MALVTAGAGGIGRAIAGRFLRQGRRVHICDIDTAAIDSFLTAHPGATASLADVSSIDQVERIFEDLTRHHGRLDILVNNAGVSGPTARVEEIAPEEWNRTVEVDPNGQFYVTRRAIPMLKQAGGGSIINISSSAAFFGFPLRAPYTACKWALIGFTKTLAMELGPFGIRVNAICPGSVGGERIDQVIERDARQNGGGNPRNLEAPDIAAHLRQHRGRRRDGVLPRVDRGRYDLGAGAGRGRPHRVPVQPSRLSVPRPDVRSDTEDL